MMKRNCMERILEKDTDGDGYGDGIEVESGYDPLKPAPGDKVIQGKRQLPHLQQRRRIGKSDAKSFRRDREYFEEYK